VSVRVDGHLQRPKELFQVVEGQLLGQRHGLYDGNDLCANISRQVPNSGIRNEVSDEREILLLQFICDLFLLRHDVSIDIAAEEVQLYSQCNNQHGRGVDVGGQSCEGHDLHVLPEFQLVLGILAQLLEQLVRAALPEDRLAHLLAHTEDHLVAGLLRGLEVGHSPRPLEELPCLLLLELHETPLGVTCRVDGTAHQNAGHYEFPPVA